MATQKENGAVGAVDTVTSREKLAQFKAACKDRHMHPERAQTLWVEFIELVEKEQNAKSPD